MTEAPTCDRCERPVADTAYVCPVCRDRLRRALDTVARVAGEAAVTIARQAVVERVATVHAEPDIETEGKAASALYPTQLPVDLAAGERHDGAVNQLITWVRHIVETRGLAVPGVSTGLCGHASCAARRRGQAAGPVCERTLPEHPTAAAATWLVGQLDWLRHRPEAAEAFDVIDTACWTIVHVVDRPADRGSLGACGVDGCTEELRQPAGASTVRCVCGVVHDVAERCARLLALAEDYWDIAAALAHQLTGLGLPCTAEMIRGYAHRGRLAPHPESTSSRPRYRLGSVREILEEQQRLDRERRLRAAVAAAERDERRAHRQARAHQTKIANGTVGASPACAEAP